MHAVPSVSRVLALGGCLFALSVAPLLGCSAGEGAPVWIPGSSHGSTTTGSGSGTGSGAGGASATTGAGAGPGGASSTGTNAGSGGASSTSATTGAGVGSGGASATSTTAAATTTATSTSATTGAGGAMMAGFDQFQNRNLDDVNMYRATLGVAPLVLDQTLCTFALAGSVELTMDHMPHQHFINASNNCTLWMDGFTNSAAENQGDPNGWTVLSPDPTQDELMQIDAIQLAMFDEGPGAGEAHGHYTNMMNATYTRLGVGLVEVNGSLYLTNDFSN